MSSEPPRDYAPSAVQAAGQAAESIVSGLKHQPALLAVVVLNALAIAAGIWFMSNVIESSQKNLQALMLSCFDGDRRQDRQ